MSKKYVTVEDLKESYNNLDEGQKSDFWYRTNQVYKENTYMKSGLFIGAAVGLGVLAVRKIKKTINERKKTKM